jgi:hypothetical protein
MRTKDWELVAVLLVVLGFMGLMIKLVMAL